RCGGFDGPPAFAEQVDHAVLADEVQRADDDEARLGRSEVRLELRDPAFVPLDDPRVVKLRESLELRGELACEAVEPAVAPRVDQLDDRAARRLDLVERLLEQRMLLVVRQTVEHADLLRDRLEAVHGLAVGRGLCEEVALDAAVRADAAPLEPEVEQRDRREPRLEALEQAKLEPEASGEHARSLVQVGVEALLERFAAVE